MGQSPKDEKWRRMITLRRNLLDMAGVVCSTGLGISNGVTGR